MDVQYLKNFHNLNNDLPFLSERMKIEEVQKLVANLHDIKEYVIHVKNLKQELNHGLVLKKGYRVIKLNQEAWLKPYIEMNREISKNAKNDFKKHFFKMMNNAVFWKTMEHVRKHRDIKLVTTNARRNYLVSEPNYHTKLFF